LTLAGERDDKATNDPVILRLRLAVVAIWSRTRDDDALMRKTIQTQLEATSWPSLDTRRRHALTTCSGPALGSH
jgi:hypothetical protein